MMSRYMWMHVWEGFITQFDESIKISFKDNISSISVDPHKFGYVPKGSSLLLWKNNKIRPQSVFYN